MMNLRPSFLPFPEGGAVLRSLVVNSIHGAAFRCCASAPPVATTTGKFVFRFPGARGKGCGAGVKPATNQPLNRGRLPAHAFSLDLTGDVPGKNAHCTMAGKRYAWGLSRGRRGRNPVGVVRPATSQHRT